jgi:hypothetical protein
VLLTTFREAVAVCCRLPLIAVIVRGKVPTGVLAVVVTVSVEVFGEASLMMTDDELRLAVTPLGSELVMLKLTCPVNPAVGVSVRV